MDLQRDLARPELWEESLERSRQRRLERETAAHGGRFARAQSRPEPARRLRASAPPRSAVELPARSEVRETADFEPWQRSLARSRARRDALAASPSFEIQPGRASVAAAALLLTGGSAVAVASGSLSGNGPDWNTATAASKTDSGAKDGATGSHSVAAPVREKAAPPKRTVASQQTPTSEAATAAKPTRPVGTAGVDGAMVASPEAASALRPPPPPKKRKASAKQGKTTTVAARKAPRGRGVVALQRALDIPVDGTFGPRTQRALKRWQRAHHVTPDGVVGPQTRAALHLGKGPVMKRKHRAHGRHGSHHKVVAAGHKRGGGVAGLQRALGLSPDGVFGPSTEKALKSWQRAHHMTPDGVAGPQTRRALHLGSGPVLKRKGRHHGRRHSSTGGGNGGGGSSSVVQRVIAAANQIATKPYVYGGGHGSFQSSGYDCSGSVSYALHGGGLLSSPLDSSAFMSYGEAGPGKHITIYANPGHMFMVVDGRRFDTSGRSQSGSRWGGGSRSGSGFTVRHPAGY